MQPDNKPTKEFIGGFYSSDVPNTTPDYILGKGSLHLEKLMTWIDTHKNLADEKGYINYTIKRSKEKGTRYVEVDTWKPKTVGEQKETSYDDLVAQKHVAPDGTAYPMDENGAIKAIYDSNAGMDDTLPF
jgi:hypothetical protein